MARIQIGNTKVQGFVNFVDGNRLILGTGSYNNKSGEKVFKESVSVFLDDKFDGTAPAKGDYVEVRGDLSVAPRKDKADELSVSMNVRFADQLTKLENPAKKTAGAGADTDI